MINCCEVETWSGVTVWHTYVTPKERIACAAAWETNEMRDAVHASCRDRSASAPLPRPSYGHIPPARPGNPTVRVSVQLPTVKTAI